MVRKTRPTRWTIALLLLTSQGAASEVCVEFLEEHLADPLWEKDCMAWMDAQKDDSLPLAAQSGDLGGVAATVSSLDAEAPVHASAANLSLAAMNQNESFIAVDPSDPMRVFALSKTHPFNDGLLTAYSTDRGLTWSPKKLAEDEEGATLPAAQGDPWAVFGDHGNLFVSYLESDPSQIRTVVVQSSDGGASFELVESLGFLTDRGSMATGPAGPAVPGASGSLWVTYRDQAAGEIMAAGAALDAVGHPVVDFCGTGTGVFCIQQTVTRDEVFPGEVRPGHIAVGPNGEVIVSYLRLGGGTSFDPIRIITALDPDGLGPQTFPDPAPATGEPALTTNVGFQEPIEPHKIRQISPLANLAWDRSSGKVYLVSTSEEPNDSDETDIVLVYSNDQGTTWSAPRLVNDDPPPTLDANGEPVVAEIRSQFFPHVAVDQTTGLVVVVWHDPRNDDGTVGSDTKTNTETEVFAAITVDGRYFHNLRVSDGFSRATNTQTSHGDYLGVDFDDGVVHVAWVDNSNIPAGDNPDFGDPENGIPHGCDPVPCMDLYTGRILVPEPGSRSLLAAGLVALSGLAVGRGHICSRPLSR